MTWIIFGTPQKYGLHFMRIILSADMNPNDFVIYFQLNNNKKIHIKTKELMVSQVSLLTLNR